MALLDVSDLSVSFHTRNGVQQAVKSVSFSVDRGEILGIVGESGSGKSVSCYSLLGLIPSPPGHIDCGQAMFDGQDLLTLSEQGLRELRGNRIAMIFQDPMTSLNPFLSIGEQLIEPLIVHRDCSRSEARQQAIALLAEVGISKAASQFDRFPHEFSGGMRQRVMIASALISEPELLIADEPSTALDVSIQAQILELIAELQRKRNIAVIFISHDLAVVKQLAQRIVVMKQGEIVEQGSSEQLFAAPQHEYTRALLDATPKGPKHREDLSRSYNVLEIRGLETSFFPTQAGQDVVHAVRSVSFDVHQGEILGLVGESGSGKSTVGRSILKLVESQAGSIKFEGEELRGKTRREMQPYRRRMQMIFQDPYASLNPRMTVFDTLAEPLRYHKLASRAELSAQVMALMDDVGLPRAFVRKYPHEFSGGQRQRIAIARALACQPRFVVADEPVSALDVTIQRQILDLLLELSSRHNLSMLFISHDLAVVRQICDRVMVMKNGILLEMDATEQLYQHPQHPYTEKLLNAAVHL